MRKLIALTLLSSSCFSYGLDGTYFSHKDWEVACDNSGTCRMAGYNPEDAMDNLLISVRITRAAGENAIPIGELNVLSEIPLNQISLQIDKQNLGDIQLSQESIGQLSPAQTTALLKALKGTEVIKFFSSKNRQLQNTLSSRGANAVMLKADEFQNRINSPSAFLRKSTVEQPVLKPQPIPQIIVPILPETKILSEKSAGYQQAKHLLITAAKDNCALLEESDFEITVQPLNQENTILSTPCNNFAYNSDFINVFVSPDILKINQVLEINGSYENKGEITLVVKERGIGDCLSMEHWAWNGKAFQSTLKQSTGMCRGFPGGAWVLPTYISQTNNKNDK